MTKPLYCLLLLILCSCNEHLKSKPVPDLLAPQFRKIDPTLKRFVAAQHGEMTTVWSGAARYSPEEHKDSFLLRVIQWSNKDTGKAIFIGPYYDTSGLDRSAWNIGIAAWIKSSPKTGKPTYHYELLKKAPFSYIEQHIDTLLLQAVNDLQRPDKKFY